MAMNREAMSAFPPKADMCNALVHVCFGPIADIFISFDHLIGAGKYCQRNFEAHCFASNRQEASADEFMSAKSAAAP